MEKYLHTITKNKENKSTIEKKYDKHGNKNSMYETVKEVEDETIIEENIMSLTRDNTTSLQDENVEYIGKINNSLMIKEGVTKKLDN